MHAYCGIVALAGLGELWRHCHWRRHGFVDSRAAGGRHLRTASSNPRSDRAKDAEILILRHHVAVLCARSRTHGCSGQTLRSRLLPGCQLRLIVSPRTLLRWHAGLPSSAD